MGTKFKITMNVSVSSFRFIWIPMLWVYGPYVFFNDFSGPSLDVRIWRLTSLYGRIWRLVLKWVKTTVNNNCTHSVLSKQNCIRWFQMRWSDIFVKWRLNKWRLFLSMCFQRVWQKYYETKQNWMITQENTKHFYNVCTTSANVIKMFRV